MPLDPNIALGFKPIQLNDPLEVQARRQQVQANALAMKHAESQNALAQQAALDKQVMGKLYAEALDPNTGTVDYTKLANRAAQLGMGSELPAIQAAGQEIKAKQQSTTKDFLSNVSSAMEVARTRLEGVRTPEQFVQWHEQNHNDPTLKEYFDRIGVTPEQSRAQIAAVANDPAAFADLLQKAQLGLEKAQTAVNSEANRNTQIQVQKMIGERKAQPSAPRAAAPAKTAAAVGAMPANGLAQSDAAVLAQAVSEGRLDPNRINSRSAPMLAATLRAAPGVNLVDVHATAATKSSPAIQARLAAFNSLPDVISSVAEAGKKVGLSNFTPLGALQVGTKAMVNDPDFRTYLTKRNDAVQAIAYAMRGVGMSDKATQLEEQGAPVNMSPRAFDAWAKGQMDIIKARQKQNAPFEVNRKGAAPGGKPSLDDIFGAKK